MGHKNKLHGTLVLYWLLIHESYISFRLVLCVVALPKVIKGSFPHRKRLNFEGYIVAPLYGYHVCPPWNVSEGITYQKFLVRETNARFMFIMRPFSSFTQTSSESKKICMAKDSILTVLCLCA